MSPENAWTSTAFSSLLGLSAVMLRCKIFLPILSLLRQLFQLITIMKQLGRGVFQFSDGAGHD